MSKREDMARWRIAEAERRKYIKLAQRDVMRYFRTIKKDVAQAVRQSYTTDQALANAIIAADQPKLVAKMIVDIWTRTGKHFIKQTRDDIGARRKQMEWFEVVDYWVQLVQSFVTNIFVTKVVGINQTTIDAIQKFINEGIEEGWSIDKIADEIASGTVSNIDAARARTIARTETIGASNAGSIEGAKSMGIDGLKKYWIVALDGRERDTHRDVSILTSETPIPIDDYFTVGGSSLQYPGDPSGGAEEVINCRCAIAYKTPLFG